MRRGIKIVAVGRNYADHIAELHNQRPTEPVLFLKPDTAIITDNKPFPLPSFSNDVHHEVEVLLRISKTAKDVSIEDAPNCYDSIGIGIDFTARDLQQKLKSLSLPWEVSKSFDGSAPISSFVSKDRFADLGNINFSLKVNGVVRQASTTSLMLFRFDEVVSHASRFFTLNEGDIIFTGTPKGVAAVHRGDRLEAFLEDDKMLDFEVV